MFLAGTRQKVKRPMISIAHTIGTQYSTELKDIFSKFAEINFHL